MRPFLTELFIFPADLSPSYVLKTDYHFEEDFEFFQEIFGIEDLEFPLESGTEVTDMALKALFKQINAADLDGLADLYKIDFEMFQYSPKMFYEIVRN